ncbi:MAG: DUF1501 domain-containing protein [Planctomycetaceae bacterium]
MLTIPGRAHNLCDGISRRDALRVGSLAVGGVTLAGLLERKAVAARRGEVIPDTAVIQIFCGGGPSHIDMYDLKPNAPAEVRGEFQEISTSVSGLRISEQLPLQAAVMDRFAIVRSVAHHSSAHDIASQMILTGNVPPRVTKDNLFPSCGSVVAKVRGANRGGLPSYVAVPRQVSFGKAAYLGSAFNPFTTDSNPSDAGFQVQNLKLTAGMEGDRLSYRRDLLSGLDKLRRDIDLSGDLSGLDSFSRHALEMITSEKAARAFDIESEEPAVRDRYGRTFIGQNCLLARRLVEAGVSYVTCLSGGGWDTHRDNFALLKNESLPRYDRAIAALVNDIYERGLDKNVLVMAFGEFGRTPRINKDAGRDHWPGAMSVLISGGGLKVGQMVGETDSKAAFPISKPYTPACVLATMYRVMGIDHHRHFPDHSDRPIAILADGQHIPELL